MSVSYISQLIMRFTIKIKYLFIKCFIVNLILYQQYLIIKFFIVDLIINQHPILYIPSYYLNQT